MKNIFVINNSNKLNNSYIFSFNLSSFLGKNDKKVLLLSSTLTTNELIINNIDDRKILSKNVIPPFYIYQFNHQLHLLLLTPKNSANLNIKDISEITRLIIKQIELIKNNYDYLVIDAKMIWSDLDLSLLKKHDINYMINFFDSSELDISLLMKNTKIINSTNKKINSEIVLDNFDRNNQISLQCFNQLIKLFPDKKITIINQKDHLNLINYVDKKPWLNLSVDFDDICNRIEENK